MIFLRSLAKESTRNFIIFLRDVLKHHDDNNIRKEWISVFEINERRPEFELHQTVNKRIEESFLSRLQKMVDYAKRLQETSGEDIGKCIILPRLLQALLTGFLDVRSF